VASGCKNLEFRNLNIGTTDKFNNHE
jgi:hypothetical protein